jgi:hypothetical protein
LDSTLQKLLLFWLIWEVALFDLGKKITGPALPAPLPFLPGDYSGA